VARKADPGDRRARLAELTPAGRTAVVEGTRLQHDTERALLTALSGDESRQLALLLEKVGQPRG